MDCIACFSKFGWTYLLWVSHHQIFNFFLLTTINTKFHPFCQPDILVQVTNTLEGKFSRLFPFLALPPKTWKISNISIAPEYDNFINWLDGAKNIEHSTFLFNYKYKTDIYSIYYTQKCYTQLMNIWLLTFSFSFTLDHKKWNVEHQLVTKCDISMRI